MTTPKKGDACNGSSTGGRSGCASTGLQGGQAQLCTWEAEESLKHVTQSRSGEPACDEPLLGLTERFPWEGARNGPSAATSQGGQAFEADDGTPSGPRGLAT